MRKMATIRHIDNLRPIPDADAIECAVVGGWNVVVKRGDYQIGDLAVYCEIDSWIPNELAPFLSKGQEPREFEGVKGERLRTVKLRGQISQGLLLPLKPTCDNIETFLFEGLDVSLPLGIQKWEAPIPAQLAGDVEGAFPSFVPKTDQERIQNLNLEFETYKANNLAFEATEKLDGSSMTVYHNAGNVGVCSRNWALKETEGNTLWKVARKYGLIDKLATFGNYAVQGELIGEGIQGNPYKLKGQDFYVYDIYDIDAGHYVDPVRRMDMVNTMGLKHVPVEEVRAFAARDTVEGLLKEAEAKSVLNQSTEREGVVFKCLTADVSFKVISNRFLIKHGG
jgi:RNA ligase (TIGR02306 family)